MIRFLNTYYNLMDKLILIITSVILLSIILTALRYGIGPVPTSPKVKQALLPLLPKLKQGTIYELGAGFGNLAFSLADHYPDHQIIAVEISGVPYLWMLARQWLKPRNNLKLLKKDFFKLTLSDAALIVCYLYPRAMNRLEEKITQECPKTALLTHTFALPHQKADVILKAKDLYNTPIYFYRGN